MGEIWRRIFVKVLIEVPGADVQLACRTDQLCSELKAGIEGGIHAAHNFFLMNITPTIQQTFCLLMYEMHNHLNRVNMPFELRFSWPRGACFLFNPIQLFFAQEIPVLNEIIENSNQTSLIYWL